MNSVLSTLGFGTRYCVVSDDHDQPEVYADDHARAPQSALERLTDFDTVYDKFSGASRRGQSEGGDSAGQRRREDTVSRGQAVLELFDRLAQRHGRTELNSFDRQFPLSGRSETTGARLPDSRGAASNRPWHPFDRSVRTTPDWALPRVTSPSPSSGSNSSSGSGPSSGPSSSSRYNSAAPSAAGDCPQGVLIDLSD